MHSRLILVAVIAAAGVARAQQDVFVPPLVETTEGSDITSYPFGYTEFRSQLIYDQTMVAASSATITAISFRPDTDNSTAKPAVSIPNVVISMSETTVAPSAMSATYAANVTGTPMQVFSGTVNLPAYTSSELALGPWFTITLDTPYSYDASKGHLLVDIVATDPNGSTSTGYALDCHFPGGTVRPFGMPGAPAPGTLPQQVSVQGSGANGRYSGLVAGGVLEASAGGFFSPAPNGFFIIGGVQSMPPLDLSIVGAPGNLIYTTPVVIDTIAPQPPLGRWLASYPLPNNGDLTGVRVYTQALLQDPGANSLGYYVTNAQQITFGVATVHMNQCRGKDPLAATGYLDKTTVAGGPATRLSGLFQ